MPEHKPTFIRASAFQRSFDALQKFGYPELPWAEESEADRAERPTRAGAAARTLRDWILKELMSFTTEADLQRAIWDRLLEEHDPTTGIVVATREWILDEHSRIDFLVDMESGTLARFTTAVGVEVKIAGTLHDVRRQLERYAANPAIHELLLVTTKASHHHMPTELGGKPVVLCSLVEAGL